MIYLLYSPATNLGNWMFQLAFAKSIWPEREIRFYVPPDCGNKKLGRVPEILALAPAVESLPQGCRMIDEHTAFSMPTEALSLLDNICLKGYYQVPSYFEADKVRALFRCPDAVAGRIDERFGAELSRLTVGVSVRRGDYLKLPHRHPFVGKTFLREAVMSFPADALFVVCSDDLTWCKRFFSPSGFAGRRFLFVEGESVLAQLFVQARCQHNIISNSTFSWWGAYLNANKGKRVVFPQRWYGPGMKSTGLALYWKGVEVRPTPEAIGQMLHARLLLAKEALGRLARRMKG